MEKVNDFNYKEYWDMFTSDFRKIGEKTLGELSTPLSFMYLFRRFGAPQYNNDDEYKILYEYRFKHKELIISIHASYHEFVYFNLLVPKKYEDLYCSSNREFHNKLVIKGFENNLAFMPYSDIYSKITKLTPEQHKKQWEIIDQEARIFLKDENYNYIDNYKPKKGEIDSKFFDLANSLGMHLCKKFRAILTPEEIEKLNNWTPQLSDYPELYEQALSFFNELKKGVWVRDCDFNIIGYASDKNNIKEHID